MYAVNSKGEISEVSEKVMTDFPDINKRKQDMLNIMQYISDNAKIKINVIYTYQKENYKEKAYIPFREEISSSDKLAKEYINYRNGNTNSEIDADIFKSIVVQKDENGISHYFLLSAGCVEIERNYADNELISIKYLFPVPYFSFAKMLVEEKDKAPNQKYTLTSNVSKEVFLKNGTHRQYSEKTSETDIKIEHFVSELMNINSDVATYSNKATDCMIEISERRKDFFTEYKIIKNMIIKTFPESYGIIYDKNKSCIRALLKKQNEEKFIHILIGGTQEKPCYIYEGIKTFSVEELRKVMINDNIPKAEWFEKIIYFFK